MGTRNGGKRRERIERGRRANLKARRTWKKKSKTRRSAILREATRRGSS